MPEHHRRMHAEQNIPQHPAADCRHDAHDADPEQIHPLADREDRAGAGEGDRACQLHEKTYDVCIIHIRNHLLHRVRRPPLPETAACFPGSEFE